MYGKLAEMVEFLLRMQEVLGSISRFFSFYFLSFFLLCTVAYIQYVNLFIVLDCIVWGISSNGRMPALHSGGTGIDTQILQLFFGFALYSSTCMFLNQICL